ncbi:MAG: tRNA epoxyqueuosine(34) reductase QueG [Clostridiales bacterium]|nr:tRNA epoxyqueuosine(34) reductase QueG [Clostridiales bacterium]
MKKKLKDFCNSINIEYVGIAPAEPYYDFEKVWRKQIERGYISGFEEKDIQKRVHPNLTLEGSQSVIVCLFPYYIGEFPEANLTKSAYSIDYHLIVQDKLELIASFLKANIDNFEYKSFVDTGPFSDRYLAYKAGLGFWGINNNLITDKYGSYVFIGYILNNYPFKPDKPMERTCYKCFNCVRKCPGQCIIGDFTINPLKCKSYITQKKKDLNPSDKDILKKHSLIWGCDVCQDVCPHNKEAKETTIKEFKENILYYLDYEELNQISNKEFIRRYHDRSFSWRGKGVLKRNHEIINDISGENTDNA